MQHELEWIERQALEDLTAAAVGLTPSLKLASGGVGGAFASVLGALPDSAVVLNRVLGLGLAGREMPELLDQIVGRYRDAGVRRYFVHLHPDADPPALESWCKERGLEQARAWMKFARGRQAPPERYTDFQVREATVSDAAEFARIEADAFDTGKVSEPLLARLVGRAGWHIFMSFDDTEAAGAGALFVKDGIGWLDWGATVPFHRGRGGQSALLCRRIAAALDLGCRIIGTTTGEEVPGDPQVSYGNILKCGFTEAYLRRNFAPPRHGPG